ncbi:hypothetical protein ABZP36_004497 [Zizania latifolia]
MGHDASASPASAAAARDARKKRGNRSSAKLKQCKLDARREQWLSQVKGGKEPKAGTSPTSTESNAGSPIVASSHPPLHRQHEDVRSGGGDPEDREEMGAFDSPVHSPSSDNSGTVGSAHRKHFLGNGDGLNLSSGSSVWSSSRSVSEAEDDENGVLDDWEAVADADTDALAVDNCHSHWSPGPMMPPAAPNVCAPPANATVRQEPIRKTRAWTPDDIFRPQSLPSISKQASFPANIGNCWMSAAQHHVHSLPLSCPVCYEDLDPTDSSFCPCPCGFLLCLFCYNTIYEADGRCPGCRKEYVAVLLSRSCSMGPRY